MRIVWAGSFQPGFSRNRKLARLLEIAGHDVRQVRVSIWGDDRLGTARRGKAKALLRAVIGYPNLAWRILRGPAPDLYIVSYPGWFDIPVVKLCASLKGRPVLFDPFISLYDTLIEDRGIYGRNHPIAWMARVVDALAVRLADRVLADTPAHASLYTEIGRLDSAKVGVLWIGADDSVFRPRPDIEVEPNLVVFHGTFVPLQGLSTIIRAAKDLEEHDVVFRIIGDGQERQAIDRLVNELGCRNVEIRGFVPLEELPPEIAKATICLGVFGTSDKAGRVIPHKVFECLAMGRPVVTGDTPAVGGAFEAGEIVVSPVGDHRRLAGTIIGLLEDREKLERAAAGGLDRYRQSFHEETLVAILEGELEMLSTSKPARTVTRARRTDG